MSYSPTTIDLFPERDVYTVSRLNFEVRDLLSAELPAIWIEGEISNVRRSGPGHLYFTLKDEDCQVSCAMFRNRSRNLRFQLEDGLQVLARAKVDLYPTRGSFQLIVEQMEESGEGALRRAFDALKTRLSNEGLFASGFKKPLPILPKQIGVITSPTGAAIRDILSVLTRRFPAIPVVVYPVPVQGQGAGEQIARMIDVVDERAECDVLVLSRGGGSLEDLWAFNEEVLARAIQRCSIPLVSGVGHEIDFTIADFVADHRAATPSAAAELITPHAEEWRQRFIELTRRSENILGTQIVQRQERLRWTLQRLVHPRRRVQDMTQRADEAWLRLARATKSVISEYTNNLKVLNARLARHAPDTILKVLRVQHQSLNRRARLSIAQRLGEERTRVRSIQRAFEAVGPQQTLERGYAIITREETGEILRDASSIREGERIHARLKSGSVIAKVEKTKTRT